MYSVQLEPQRGQRKVSTHTACCLQLDYLCLNVQLKLPNKTTHLISSLSAFTPASLPLPLWGHIYPVALQLRLEKPCFQWFIDYWYELTLSLAPCLTFCACLSPSVCVSRSPLWGLIETEAWRVQLAKLCFQWIYNLLIQSLLYSLCLFTSLKHSLTRSLGSHINVCMAPILRASIFEFAVCLMPWFSLLRDTHTV